MFPSPIFPSIWVVDWVRPWISILLSLVWLVRNLQVWQIFFHFLVKLLNCEANGSQVVTGANFDTFARGIHYIYCGLDCVVHVHHWQFSILIDKTLIFSMQDPLLEDCDCIVCCSSSWRGFPTDDSWVSKSSHIQAEFMMIVLTQELTRVLSHPIHCSWFVDRVLRSIINWSSSTEGCNGTGHK